MSTPTLRRAAPLVASTAVPRPPASAQRMVTDAARPSAPSAAAASAAATAGGGVGGLLAVASLAAAALAVALRCSRREDTPVAFAAYQSEFGAGAPASPSALRAAAAGDADATKKLASLKKDAQDKMDAAVEALNTKFATVRTGRANPALLDRIRVEAFGALTPLKQVAGISVADSSTIVIAPFDRATLGAIEKAIGSADLGMTPSNDGERIRVKVPTLTADRRKEMVKTVTKFGEEGKVSVRNVRRDILKAAEKLKLSENAEAGFKADVQKLTDKYTKKLEEMIQAKEKDLTTM